MKKPKKVAVLGVGRVGKAIALNLSEDYQVVAVDSNSNNLKPLKDKKLQSINENATDPQILTPLILDCDLVVNALPGFLGFKVLKAVIGLGKSIVDISFFSEDPFTLDKLAKAKGVTAVVDCGIAPGFSNMVIGHHYKKMSIDTFICYVGGLPKVRLWPYEYKAPFSPIDVIEEYTRPARFIENNRTVVKQALSDIEHIELDRIGSLEAFNTDGLRTLLKTVKVPNMKEKTLRYLGHSEKIKILRESGFFSNKSINIKGVKISPMEVTSRVLFPHWQLAENEEEFTIMRIIIEGKENGKQIKYIYHLYDEYDKNSHLTSMARTTGYTCCAVARLVLENQIDDIGIIPPEFITMRSGKFDQILGYLKSRNIDVKVSRIIED